MPSPSVYLLSFAVIPNPPTPHHAPLGCLAPLETPVIGLIKSGAKPFMFRKLLLAAHQHLHLPGEVTQALPGNGHILCICQVAPSRKTLRT
ncbi:hypothetical protein E2C01_060122 [Portunus trituberculatus]|uniref:Uncharacterized protein n=1 Tax=Portunus trituberculatus TaxID=210409 RepID=A0A5B7HAI3_PORTR|nr:hypothetical protein [Portunus trituberculatus]